MVSVLMSVYNEKEKDLRQAIDSILTQTYQSLELIIVLDNPQSILLKNILLDYQKHFKKIILIINEKNIGLAGSLNKAFLHSQGKYIARMDADDISYPTRIEKQVKFMEDHKEYAIVGSNRVDIDEDENIIRSDHKVITNLEEPLIKYRIRKNSISNQNAYLQMLSGAYIQKNKP